MCLLYAIYLLLNVGQVMIIIFAHLPFYVIFVFFYFQLLQVDIRKSRQVGDLSFFSMIFTKIKSDEQGARKIDINEF